MIFCKMLQDSASSVTLSTPLEIIRTLRIRDIGERGEGYLSVL